MPAATLENPHHPDASPAPFVCRSCGSPSWVDPSDQAPAPDVCQDIDHGTEDDRIDPDAESTPAPKPD